MNMKLELLRCMMMMQIEQSKTQRNGLISETEKVAPSHVPFIKEFFSLGDDLQQIILKVVNSQELDKRTIMLDLLHSLSMIDHAITSPVVLSILKKLAPAIKNIEEQVLTATPKNAVEPLDFDISVTIDVSILNNKNSGDKSSCETDIRASSESSNGKGEEIVKQFEEMARRENS